ncbi:hypothetical protein EVAR_33632_1 [Eumeta japonica]|uniref:Uncharacterized protein n=1 Tax=Eumeta variegata TaxID=151549 RepID=A0A4C1WCS0_EUMVA|nr:hypothetical protein EVAR_33632_1 [Eumeta japonica]
MGERVPICRERTIPVRGSAIWAEARVCPGRAARFDDAPPLLQNGILERLSAERSASLDEHKDLRNFTHHRGEDRGNGRNL